VRKRQNLTSIIPDYSIFLLRRTDVIALCDRYAAHSKKVIRCYPSLLILVSYIAHLLSIAQDKRKARPFA